MKRDELKAQLEAVQSKEWAVYCPGCKVQWIVDYEHPGAELCEVCERIAMTPPDEG